ncbi:hypothetical protein RsTz2092_06070 [Deferribacterales bacterium RsTz2092]|nr:hypothetical protein AGMMS49941_02940 [Deferribacterales bacterium]
MLMRFAVLLCIATLCACAVLSPQYEQLYAGRASVGDESENKPDVNEQVARLFASVATSNSETICSYKGRATLTYNDGSSSVSSPVVMSKDCSDNVSMMFSAMGMPVASVAITADSYKITSKGRDATGDAIINSSNVEDVRLFISYMRLPAPLPDDTFQLYYDKRAKGQDALYMFVSNTETISVLPDFKVSKVQKGYYTINYEWVQGKLVAMSLEKGGVSYRISFANAWRLK